METICCPSPDQPVIQPTEKTTRYRKALYAFMFGEIGGAIARAYIFGLLTGIFHLISIWIDYSAYATMHYCGTTIVCFCAVMEIMMLFMNANDGGELQAAIFETTLSTAMYGAMMTFSIVKLVTTYKIYKVFKEEHQRQVPQVAGRFE